jgi:ribosomal protein L37AE/L43A
MSTAEQRIVDALADRKAKLDQCPVRRRTIGDHPCPKCKATTAGPCWLNVEADAAFVDAMKEIVA